MFLNDIDRNIHQSIITPAVIFICGRARQSTRSLKNLISYQKAAENISSSDEEQPRLRADETVTPALDRHRSEVKVAAFNVSQTALTPAGSSLMNLNV